MDYPQGYTDISAETYEEQFGTDAEHYLIDVREIDEFAEARIPGTVNIPLSEFETRYTEIAKDKPIVLICARGGRSAMAAEFLAHQQYTDLYNLEGGTLGWMMSGRPVEQS